MQKGVSGSDERPEGFRQARHGILSASNCSQHKLLTTGSSYTSRHSREDYPPAAVDVRVKRDDSHVGLAREVRNLVPDLQRSPSSTHKTTQLAAAVVAIVVRHRSEGPAHEIQDDV